jgi:predicted RNA-binding protein with PIN domain
MSIVVDYYNFLYKRYYDITAYIIEKNLSLLREYSTCQRVTIILVFDSFFFRDQIINTHKDIIIFFSDPGVTADDFILKKFSHYQGTSHILVSDDLLLKKQMKSRSRFSYMSTEQFWYCLDTLCIRRKKKAKIKKITHLENDEVDNLYFDNLSSKDD